MRVVLPGEIAGMAVLGHEELREFLAHPDVAKDPRHFTALREGRVPTAGRCAPSPPCPARPPPTCASSSSSPTAP
ncbi:hypothetical protein M2168_000110 [Streptomyces sp. CZ24]|nr:hypothetical protein [Streptomyces sp. CZ24]